MQGKDKDTAEQLLCDAQAVQDAGAFAVVLELVPTQLAQEITERLKIPTIGIGAGPHCSGQVQVFHDILGLYPSFGPRHAKKFVEAGEAIQKAIGDYVEEVKSGQFPTLDNGSSMSDEILASIRGRWK